mmetsp:Transcript_34944/g.54614  ORF Transcript_34944/g.54614 Transcript_34944/m.54614 type:complete len:403 (+) Transcript_34944:124-1332(+)
MSGKRIEQPWLFSAEQIKNSPSRQDNIDFEDERSRRKSVCKLIAEIGQTVRATVTAINTAKVFFHRVFMVQSMEKQNPKLVGVTCLFLACKSEECLCQLKHFIWTLNKLDRTNDGQKAYPFGKRTDEGCSRPWEIKEDSEGFQELKEKILACERVCLHVLGFELNATNPHCFLDRFIRFFDSVRKEDKEKRRLIATDNVGVDSDDFIGRQVQEMATAMANDSTTTTVCLQYEAGIVAAAILHLALKIRKYSLMKMPKWCEKLSEELKAEKDARLRGLVVQKESIEDISAQLLDLYDESTNKTTDSADAEQGSSQNGHNSKSDSAAAAAASTNSPQAEKASQPSTGSTASQARPSQGHSSVMFQIPNPAYLSLAELMGSGSAPTMASRLGRFSQRVCRLSAAS